MAIPTGSTLAILTQGTTANAGYAAWRLSGTYTAADFTIDSTLGLGFSPAHARVVNQTDRTETEGWSGQVSGVKTVANGTRTYALHGIGFSGNALGIDISVAGPITDSDTAIIEAWS